MAIDGKNILEKLKGARNGDRGRVTLYLSKSLYKAFRAKCGDIPVSIVLEELLREFLATASDQNSASRNKK